MLPWFNKYPTSDFHELNIDWLCDAYKNFYEQLQAFDTRLDGLETEVNQRLDAQDQRITDFEASVQAEFNQLRQDINDQFDSLETSFNERFTTLENNLTAEIEALEAQVNQEFEDLSSTFEARFEALESQVETALSAFSTRLTDAEDDINILKDEDAAIVGNMLSSGFYNYMDLPASETLFPDVESLTVNVGNGIIVASGTTDSDVSYTLGGGPSSFPAGMDSLDADMHFYYTSNMIPGSGNPGQPLNFEVIFYQNGAEVDRKVFTWSGTPPTFDITSAYYDTLSGIELILKAVSGVTYNIRYAPMLAGALLSEDIITLKGLNNSVKNANKLISDRNYFDGLVNSKNAADYPSVTPIVIEEDGITITVNTRDITVNGTASEPLNILVDAFSFSFEPDTDYKYYADLISGSYTPTYQGDTLKQVIAFTDSQRFTLFELNEFKTFNSTSIPYTVEYRLEIPAGSYNNVKFSTYISKNMSNLQLEENVTDLDERVEDIEDQLMGETTYGPANPVTFVDPVGDVPLKEVIVNIEPIQDLHGYNYPWPAGGNKNLVDITAGSYAAGASLWSGSLTLAAGTYTLSAVVQGSVPTIAVLGVGSGQLPYTFEVSEATTITGIQAVTAANIENIQLEAGSAPTSYVPYANVCPITGRTSTTVTHTGKNIFNDTTGTHTINANTDVTITIGDVYLKANTTYTISCKQTPAPLASFVRNTLNVVGGGTTTYNSAGNDYTIKPMVFTPSVSGTYSIRIWGHTLSATTTYSEFQVEVGSTATAYEPFVRETYTILFGQTVYRGNLNVTTGILTADAAYIASYAGETITGPWISSMDRYIEGTNPSTGAEVVYPITPVSIQINPLSIRTFQNTNNMYAETGSLTVTTQSFVESLIELYTERYIVSYDSSTQTIDKTYNEIYEAYTEGRRIVFSYEVSGNTLLTELNQFDSTGSEFHFEYNTFTAAGIDFTEIVISSSGVSITTKSVSI